MITRSSVFDSESAQSYSAIVLGLGIAVGLGHRTRIRHCSRTRPSYSDSALQSNSAIGLGLGHDTRTLATVACHQASSSRLSDRTAWIVPYASYRRFWQDCVRLHQISPLAPKIPANLRSPVAELVESSPLACFCQGAIPVSEWITRHLGL